MKIIKMILLLILFPLVLNAQTFVVECIGVESYKFNVDTRDYELDSRNPTFLAFFEINKDFVYITYPGSSGRETLFIKRWNRKMVDGIDFINIFAIEEDGSRNLFSFSLTSNPKFISWVIPSNTFPKSMMFFYINKYYEK